MGKHFGNLQKLKGVIYYSVSPYELNPFRGMINPGIRNTIRRCSESFFFVTIPIVGFCTVRHWANEENERVSRKDPNAYKDEV